MAGKVLRDRPSSRAIGCWTIYLTQSPPELMVDWLADRFGIDQRALATRSLNPLV